MAKTVHVCTVQFQVGVLSIGTLRMEETFTTLLLTSRFVSSGRLQGEKQARILCKRPFPSPCLSTVHNSCTMCGESMVHVCSSKGKVMYNLCSYLLLYCIQVATTCSSCAKYHSRLRPPSEIISWDAAVHLTFMNDR